MANRQLTRSSTDRMISGVCGGLGEYFNLDATVVRVIYVVLTLVTGLVPGAIAYFLLAIIIPEGRL